MLQQVVHIVTTMPWSAEEIPGILKHAIFYWQICVDKHRPPDYAVAYVLTQGTNAAYSDKNVRVPGLLLLFSSPAVLKSDTSNTSQYEKVNRFVGFHSSAVHVSVLLTRGVASRGGWHLTFWDGISLIVEGLITMNNHAFRMRMLCYLKTSGTNHQIMWHAMSEEQGYNRTAVWTSMD
jgi:meiotically up-regulated gene 157 (Mug157) protein